ncbi:hypothetical protein [Ensifer sp. ENS03]|uniref:hypothetical protein n=1 Tax=Ensifer TaxID=106591 RepID=UPI000675DC56|nr:hypothetical protein [Ensifer sp. ENS03]MBD9560819.1 hypothetical protein [Ensifer sp. ENS03]
MIRRRDHRQITNGHRSEKFPIRPHRVGVLEPHGTLEQCTLVEYIHDRTGYTTVFVTHDQGKALELADRIVVLNNGSNEQTGTPDEISAHPSQFVYGFIGQSNCLSVSVSGREIWLEGRSTGLPTTEHDGQAALYFRPTIYNSSWDPNTVLWGLSPEAGAWQALGHLEVRLEKFASVVQLELPPDRAPFPPESRIAFKTKWMLFRGEQLASLSEASFPDR